MTDETHLDRKMMDSTSILLALVLGGILFLWVRHLSHGWRGPTKSGARLPKGSFGWPVIGESLAFATNPIKFYDSRVKRYGTVFKSNLFAQPNVNGTTVEFAKFLMTNSDLFVSGWPTDQQKLLGSKSFMFRDGLPHMTVKKLIIKPIQPDTLRSQVRDLETIILKILASWVQKGTVVGRDATQMITLETAFWFLIRAKDIQSTAEGRKALEDFRLLSKGVFALPINLPGTTFNRGLKAKGDLTAFLKPILQKRKSEENPQNDILGALLSAQNDGNVREELKDLDDDRILDNLVVVLYAAYDSNSTTFTWILKFLIDYPDVFRRIQAEHQEILKHKDPSVEGPRLDWEDIRKMEYTSQFFFEVQRHVSIVPFLMRKAAQDIEYEGHLIPKGWGLCAAIKAIHLDPAVYPDPQVFNPDRFSVVPKPYTYLPFGGGNRMCPGLDATKLIALIYIHHLATTFSFDRAGPDRGLEYKTLPVPVGGYPINIRRATKST